MEKIWRRSARAILLDDEARLVLIKRTKPGRRPWWTTAGGGVEESDDSVEAALYRELREELGAEATGARQVLLLSSPAREGGIVIAHFFVVRLVRMDVSARSGPEFDDPARGAYDPDRFDLYGAALGKIDLRPPEVRKFILANREALLIEAGLLG